MRKNVISFVVSSAIVHLILVFVLMSCNQEDSIYSCNPEINLWVQENKEEIEKMSPNEFLALEQDYQKASYIVFSPKQRENLWINKITESLKLDWSVDEKKHLNKLLVILQKSSILFFKDCPENAKDDFKLWVYQWIKEGEEEYNWTPELIRNLLYSPNLLLNKDGKIVDGKIKRSQVKTRSEGGDGRNCNCNSNSSHGEGIFANDCSKESQCVQGYWNCQSKWAGCGLLFLDPCDGYCW